MTDRSLDLKSGARRPLALVTGASTGIGRAFVSLLVREGYDVIGVARSGALMEEHRASLLAECEAACYDILALDLSLPGATAEVAAAVERDQRALSLLVNNAGYGSLGAFAGSDRQEQLGMADLNNRVAVDLTHRLLPDIKATRGGIINIASLSAFTPMPYLAIYSASKAFLKVFSTMLALELKGTGVRVTAVCPGYTETPFHKRAGVGGVSVPGFVPKQTPQAVARSGYRGWQNGKRVVVTGGGNAVTAFLAPALQPLFNLIGRLANKRVNGDDIQ